MSLLTGRLIQARSFTPLPMPEEVIGQVDSMGNKVGQHDLIFGDSQGMPIENDQDPDDDYIPEDEEDVPLVYDTDDEVFHDADQGEELDEEADPPLILDSEDEMDHGQVAASS